MRVARREGRVDVVSREEALRVARVFSDDEIGFAQRGQQTQRDIVEVAQRRGANEQRHGRMMNDECGMMNIEYSKFKCRRSRLTLDLSFRIHHSSLRLIFRDGAGLSGLCGVFWPNGFSLCACAFSYLNSKRPLKISWFEIGNIEYSNFDQNRKLESRDRSL